ncbi:energy-coupling factor transporter transmembrane component T [Halanaerocella petrolearia]
MKLFKDLLDKLSVERLKMALMETAYGNQDTFLAKLDPRVLIVWYLMFAILPWFFFNKTILAGLLLFMIVMAIVAKVSRLIIFLLTMSTVSQLGSVFIVTFFFGGGLDGFASLLTITLKLLVIAVASIAVFTSIDPEEFSEALLSFGISERYSFGVSYGYRVLPLLFEEYNDIFNSFRLRGKTPEKKGFLGWRYIYYLIKIIILGFYPMVLNVAKRTRTTVEALEVKGFANSLDNKKVKELKLADMEIGLKEVSFLVCSVLIVVAIVKLGSIYPL